MRHQKNGLAILAMSCAVAALLAGCGKKDEAAKETGATTAAPKAQAVGDVATADTMPRRKPGLWSQSISAEGMPSAMVNKVCLDEATDRQMSIMGSQASKKACPDSRMVKTATGYDFSATCNMGTGGKSVSSGKVTGDYSSKYDAVINTTTSGAAAPHMNRTATVKIASEWLGPCPADMAPGDQDLPNGMRINMTGFDPAKARALAKDAAKAAGDQ